ncbi:separin isoform X2 [Numida meleagris]|uniref:separin isoform X2 n=1 Tax=Numida meleagris TaxID=8996 RepID=UPI000B3DAAB6|nr:separin isoform X2 [Numida meleagris]
MKRLKGADFVSRTASPEGTEELLAELSQSLSCGAAVLGSVQSTVCDRILRACVQRLGEPSCCLAHATSLLALAEAACRGYVTAATPPPTPLYLEKILYHLLKNAAARSHRDACRRAAELLHAQLCAHRRSHVPCADFSAVAHSSFCTLWSAAGTLGDRLQALRFLLLLEDEEGAVLPLEPPFFTSQTARQAAAAALSKVHQAPSSACFGRELGGCLLASLRKDAARPPALPQALCFFELALEQCRQLCKGGCYEEAEAAVRDARCFLGSSMGGSEASFSEALALLEAGVELSWALATGTGSVGPALARAAAALGSAAKASGRFLRALAEGCQFVTASLSERARSSQQRPLPQEDVLQLCAFVEGHCRVLTLLLGLVPPDGVKQWLVLKQLLYHSLQLFTSMACDTFRSSQVAGWPGQERLTLGCQDTVTLMLEALEGLPQGEQAKYLDITASCTFKLAYIFYNQNLHEEACSISELFCRKLKTIDAFRFPEIPPERLHRCFRLQVESYRKLGRLESALASCVQWLVSLRGRIRELLAEPIGLWARVKTDSMKQGAEDLRLRTLKEELSAHHLDTDTLVAVLFAELKAYKGVRADTGQERYNVLCDLLEICSEESGRLHERAAGLVELAQVLCYHNYAQQTDCSALDSVHEALRLLDSVPRNAENREQLLDDQAQALLWLYICTLESKLEEGIAREQRVKALGQKSLEDFEPNDLNYESRMQEDAFLNSGISFNLVTELAQSKSLDDALALWKQLLASQCVPAVRSPEQTVASLLVAAALYRLMDKPLQAMESYLLVRALCSALGDDLGTAGALCQVTKLLLQLECPSYAKLFLEETESCLQRADRDSDSYLLLQQTCLVLRSQLYCASHQIKDGTALLLEVLRNPALQKTAKVWYVLQAQVLQLTATYLSLPPAHLCPEFRQHIFAQGWKTAEIALSEAHKLLRSIILLLTGSSMLGSHKSTADVQFVDCGDNVLQKWQVLADVLCCSERLVVLLSRVEVMCKAKAFCLEAIKLAVKLQAIRWCVSFLVLKAQLELQQSELELSHWDLQQALFLLESGTEFEADEKQRGPLKILPRKGKPEGRKQQDVGSEPPGEDEGFLKGPALEFVAMVSGLEKADDLSSSPQLKPKRKRRLAFLAHPAACPCCLCSDLTLSSICLRWLLSCARGELAAGSAAEGLGLIHATLQRCGTVAPRFAVLLQDKLGNGHDTPALKLLDDLVATGYTMLALHSLAGPRPEEKLEEQLKVGLSFLASCSPHLPSLGVSRASLLLAKATAAVCRLATKHGGSVDTVFASSWAWQPAPPSPTEPKAAVAAPGMDRAQLKRLKNKAAAAASPVLKPRAKKTQRAKPPSVADTKDTLLVSNLDTELPAAVSRTVTTSCTLHMDTCPHSKARARGSVSSPARKPRGKKNQKAKHADTNDVFALGDSDSEVPPIVIRPAAVPCTPRQKSCPPARTCTRGAAMLLRPRAPFTVFSEASPPLSKSQLLKAPKARGKIRSRLPVTFSDDSDIEGLKSVLSPVASKAPDPSCKTPQSASCSRRALLPQSVEMGGSQLSSSSVGRGCGSRTRPQRGRRVGGTEKKERTARRAPSWKGDEERELLRAIEEEEKVEEQLNVSLELLRASEDGAEGRIRCRQEGTDVELEVLRQEASSEVLVQQGLGRTEPLCLSALHNALPTVDDTSSLDRVCGLLRSAFSCISHCPPGTLYSQLCQLLALATGDQDPITTACLLAESISVTTRHQLLSIIHRKLHKEKKSVADVAEQLQGLSLQDKDAASHRHHLTRLQDLFSFSPTGLGPQECTSFSEQLQQIPAGVTACVLTLVNIHPASVGDTLLLTRLERGSTPITVRIPTAHTETPLSSVLRDFDSIQKEQKEASNHTDKRDWWLCRFELDQRMKNLIETLEMQVLGCWKAALLPAAQDPLLAEEAACLCAQLQQCGWWGKDPTLLKVVLNAAALLSPADVRALAAGLCPAQPGRAQLLLQEALEKRKNSSQEPHGSVVLLLDKHLQKLPWESMACLRDLPVTRLPSLRFLLSYALAQRQTNSVLCRGIDPSRTFYILNPQNNLLGTEERFRSWFESYAGHGAGARLLDGQAIAQLQCRAVTLLFGCSSAALAVRGNLEGTGIVLKYIMAGCPLVLGNLWDVTDRDIDRYAEALLRAWLGARPGAPLLRYVAEARRAPRLQHLIGAAPVAYGLPVALQ